jgi:prepilin-type N-terminal cleavage/methylation domain-containing protein
MRKRAFSLVEVFVVIAVLAVLLVVIIIPGAFKAQRRSKQANCTNNLKQIGLGFRMWADDNSDLFPMKYYTNSSGAMQFANASNIFRSFLVISNEINNPERLVCPNDKQRTNVEYYVTITGSNISYFVGLDADETNSASLLSGDRNITNGTALQNGILYSGPATPANWTTTEQHLGRGNILLSDSSVQQTSVKVLRNLLGNSGLATNRLGMP